MAEIFSGNMFGYSVPVKERFCRKVAIYKKDVIFFQNPVEKCKIILEAQKRI